VTAVRRQQTKRQLAPSDRTAIGALLERAHAADGHVALNDHLLVDLRHDPISEHTHIVAVNDGNIAIAHGQASRVGGTWMVGLVIDPDRRNETIAIGTDVIADLLSCIAADGGGQVRWWVADPTPDHETVAAVLGLDPGRELLQMRRPPLAVPTPEIVTRTFVVGDDDTAWLAVNNRAFAGHDEQGNWDIATLHARQAEDWFEPEGFVLHERDGRLAGFCWTKVHRDETPPVGEIYVIGVDPDFHGLGLGRALTAAGLANMASRGITSALLFVDATNTAARTLYDSLGFVVERRDLAFTTDITTTDITTTDITTA
jgi:mycothiol synthase